MLSDEYWQRKRRANATQSDGPDPMLWMITFSDLLMLILTMFVMRLSMLTLDLGKHPGTPSATQSAASVNGVSVNPPQTPQQREKTQHSGGLAETAPLLETPTEPREAEKLTAVTQAFYHIFGQQAPLSVGQSDGRFGSEMTIRYHAGRLTASLLDGSFGAPGDELTFHGSEAVATIAKTFGDGAFDIHISAHSRLLNETDYFGSDLELSSARALAVLRQMLDAGVDPQCLKVSSYDTPSEELADKSVLPNRVDIDIQPRNRSE
ncbi:MAG: flagellar motor protein MotB [Bdellovibrionota bacterium]